MAVTLISSSSTAIESGDSEYPEGDSKGGDSEMPAPRIEKDHIARGKRNRYISLFFMGAKLHYNYDTAK